MQGRDLLDVLFSDIKPGTIKLTGLQGYSMYPNIVKGDKIYLDYDDVEDLNDGEVVVVKNSSGRTLIHRYYEEVNRTKGDSTLFYDDPGFKVLAKVKKVKPGLLKALRKHKHKLLSFNPEEIQLVVALCRHNFSEIKNDLAIDRIDFEKLIHWIRINELSLFFASQIDDWSPFPKDFEEALLFDFEKGYKKLLIMFEAYNQIKEDFALMGIPIIPMKGVDFNRRYFDDPFQRNLSDIDIMVEPHNLQLLLDNLKESDDYEFPCKEYNLKFEHHIQVRIPKYNNLLLEIHFKHSYMDLEGLWGSYFNHGILNHFPDGIKFSEEANICIISSSFFTSSGEYYKSVVDAYRIFTKVGIDYKKLTRISRELDCEKRVERFVSIVNSFFPEVKPIRKQSYADKIRDGFVRSFMFSTGMPPRIKRALFRTLLFESPGNYMSYCLKKMKIALN